ncbi:D(2) dopamine receptor-like [Patiria miniata]|uniref:G-protein coupled receptors family 1 profile domain-containing protein n=1 Tax=Patiria miniata TaxID=46514 RepID=A0A913ZQ48_PATMI|nr:D(2) dopamine receptor-like [Patiria miniata]
MENTSVPNSTALFENAESDSGLSDTAGNIFQLIVQSVIFLFGVPGNCLILRVYWTKTLKTSTHVFIMGLAWADLVVCVLAVHRIYDKVADMAGYEVPQFTFIIWALDTTAIATSIMMTAVIAADRYDCVCRPHRRFFTHKRGKISAFAAFVFSLVINIPAFIPTTPASRQSLGRLRLAFQVICFVVALVMIALCYGKVYMTIKKHTKVGVKSTTGDRSVSRLADEWSTRLQDSVITNVGPNIPTVSSVSTLISKPCSSAVADGSRMALSKGPSSREIDESTLDENGIRLASHSQATLTKRVLLLKETESRVANRNSDPSQRQSNAERAPPKTNAAVLQRKTTRMLFITSVVFLLTWLPYWMRLAAVFASYYDPVFRMILEQLSVTLYVNNAVNPLIYGLANRRFRKDCKTILSKIKLC